MTKNEILLANQPKFVPVSHHQGMSYEAMVRCGMRKPTVRYRLNKQATNIAVGMMSFAGVLLTVFIGLAGALIRKQ